jgi:hypothetical protein
MTAAFLASISNAVSVIVDVAELDSVVAVELVSESKDVVCKVMGLVLEISEFDVSVDKKPVVIDAGTLLVTDIAKDVIL